MHFEIIFIVISGTIKIIPDSMKKNIFLICSFLYLSVSLSAQKYEPVIVKAGTKILDYFPFEERYRFPAFTPGQVIFKNGNVNSIKLNYNLLMDNMEFIQSADTLTFVRKKDIRYIVITADTFYYDNGYLEQIYSGAVKVAVRQRIKLKEVLKKDSYGTSSSGSSTNSYGLLPTEGSFYKLTINEDMVFQKMLEFYLSTSSNGFVQFKKKSVLQLFPGKNEAIKSYIKSNKVDFDSREDLLKLADFLSKM
jgi:hypothetical protein